MGGDVKIFTSKFIESGECSTNYLKVPIYSTHKMPQSLDVIYMESYPHLKTA